MATRRFGRLAVDVSNEDKILFPDTGLTKGALVDYYQRIGDRILPHLRGRPLVLQRFPDGIGRDGFYQKQVGESFPKWVETVRVDLRSASGTTQELVVCDKKATLAFLADQACVALHPWLSRHDALDDPDVLVVDLDPPGDDFSAARTAALRVRDLFDELDLPSFVKLSGSKGLHVVVPLDRSEGFDVVREFTRSAMELLAARYPDDLTTEQRKANRRGRVYLDCGRNAYGQTAVAPWSVRALPEAPVAAPISWGDVSRGELRPREYTVENLFRRLAGRKEPWAGWRRRARSLKAARSRLASARREELERSRRRAAAPRRR